jgi:Protein of unknown function (DUF3102)
VKNSRSLKRIESELEAAFQREKQGPIEIGGLLAAAKELLTGHGEWLPWLKAKFPHSVRTAQDYMAAHRFATKYATVAHLKVAAGGLYALAVLDNAGNTDMINAALREAETQWVDADRVAAIVAELRQPPDTTPAEDEEPPPSPPEEVEDTRPVSSEEPGPILLSADCADDEDDAPPPLPLDDDKPPPPPLSGPTPKQAGLTREFDTAASALRRLMARRSDDFTFTSMSTVDLLSIGNFILQVAAKRARPDGDDVAVEIAQELVAR